MSLHFLAADGAEAIELDDALVDTHRTIGMHAWQQRCIQLSFHADAAVVLICLFCGTLHLRLRRLQLLLHLLLLSCVSRLCLVQLLL